MKAVFAKRGVLVVAVACIAYFSLGLYGVLGYWVNPDEGIYVDIAREADEGTVWSRIRHNAHPPLYYMMLRAMARIHDGIWWLRLPSLIAGSLVPLLGFLAARRLLGTTAGLTAAIALLVSPALFGQAQIIRPYATTVFLLTSAIWLLIRWSHHRRRLDLCGYSLCVAGAGLMHYGSYLVFVALGAVYVVWIVGGHLRGRHLVELLAAHLPIAAAALYLVPHVAHLHGGALQEDVFGWLGACYIREAAGVLYNPLDLVFYLWNVEVARVVLAVLLIGPFLCRMAPKGYWLVVLAVGVTLILSVVLAAVGVYPFGGTRHSIVHLPVLAIALGSSVAALFRRGWWAALAVVGVGILLVPSLLKLTEHRWPRYGRLNEQLTTMSERQPVLAILDTLHARGGVLFLGMQDYLVLDTEISEQLGEPLPGETGGVRVRPFGEAWVVFISRGWTYPSGLDGVDGSNHLIHIIDEVARDYPGLEPELSDTVYAINAGWVLPLVDGLAAVSDLLPDEERCADTESGPGWFYARIHIRPYREAIRKYAK